MADASRDPLLNAAREAADWLDGYKDEASKGYGRRLYEALTANETRADRLERALRGIVLTLPQTYENSAFYATDEWRTARAILGLPVAERRT